MGHENGGWMNEDQRGSMKPAKEKPSEAGSNPSAGAAQSGGQLLPCGHDVSNRDTALESGTVFCRFCDLQGRCRDAETMEKEFREKYTEAAKLVADMHCAAVGSVRGPIRGVVEDITNLRIDRDRLLALIKRVAETPLMAHADKMLPPQRDALLALHEAAQGGPLWEDQGWTLVSFANPERAFEYGVLKARNEAREAIVRRACEIMGWPYKTSPVLTGIRAVANGMAVSISVGKLHLLLDRISPRPGRCEHGVQDGDWCEPCNLEMKTAAKENV